MASALATEQKTVPLCVDLDGTLIFTDLLWEGLVKLLSRNPLAIFPALIWWTRGRAYLKARLARRTKINLPALPYNQQFLEYVRAERRAGRKVILVTASDEAF